MSKRKFQTAPNLLTLAVLAGSFAVLASAAFAQPVPAPIGGIVTGYISTSGCPGGAPSCFVQYGAGGGVASTVAQGTPGSSPWVTNSPLLAPVTGQAVIAVTGTAVQLGTNTLQNGIIIKALSSNTASILVGGSGVNNSSNGSGNGYILKPGEASAFSSSNSNQFWVNGTAGDIVTFEGN